MTFAKKVKEDLRQALEVKFVQSAKNEITGFHQSNAIIEILQVFAVIADVAVDEIEK